MYSSCGRRDVLISSLLPRYRVQYQVTGQEPQHIEYRINSQHMHIYVLCRNRAEQIRVVADPHSVVIWVELRRKFQVRVVETENRKCRRKHHSPFVLIGVRQ
jgi:hypothetical protein